MNEYQIEQHEKKLEKITGFIWSHEKGSKFLLVLPRVNTITVYLNGVRWRVKLNGAYIGELTNEGLAQFTKFAFKFKMTESQNK